MKRKRVDELLEGQVTRRKKVISYISIIFILTILIVSLSVLFLINNKTKYIPYTENSNLDYKVHYKKNKFFKNNTISSKNQYISSLIDYIDSNFKYNLNIEDNQNTYKYSYKIEASVEVIDKDSKNNLYTHKDKLLDSGIQTTSKDNTSIKIDKNIIIDYNKYNNLIKKFVNVYDLDNAESTLNINMYVKILGECQTNETKTNNAVVSISIPLTQKTMSIDLGYDLVNNKDKKLLECKSTKNYSIIYLIIAILLLITEIIIVCKLIKFIINTRTAETIYEKELKKILNNYKSYIQKINNSFDLKGYQVMKVDTFTDMLEIRETIGAPILMLENQEKNGVFFLIPSGAKLIYIYALKVNEIRKKIDEEKMEDWLIWKTNIQFSFFLYLYHHYLWE